MHQDTYLLQLFSNLLKHGMSLKALQCSGGASEHRLDPSATAEHTHTHTKNFKQSIICTNYCSEPYVVQYYSALDTPY